MKLGKSKKSWFFEVGLVLFTVVFLISLAYVLVSNIDKLKGEDQLGAKQADILQVVERGETAQLYIDKSADLAVDAAILKLAKRGGFSSEQKCGNYMGFPLWNARGEDCYPEDPEYEFKKIFGFELKQQLPNYGIDQLPYDYTVSIKNQLDIKGVSISPMYLTKKPIGYYGAVSFVEQPDTFTEFNPFYTVETIVIAGDPADEPAKIAKCPDGACVAGIARDYAQQFKGFPYVWGGVSPYTYEATIYDKENNPDSIFKSAYIHKIQPGNNKRAGLKTVPGFDCSGFVWWVLKHAGVVDERLTAKGFYDYAKRNKWQQICAGAGCTEDDIKEKAMPGDIMFIKPCGVESVCHVGIYMGEKQIAESTGGSGVVYRTIPDSYYAGGKVGMQAIYRPVFSSLTPTQATGAAKLQNVETVQSTQTGITSSTAVFDAPIDGDSFVYLITPAFKVHRDYDLGIYKTLREEGRQLIKEATECENKKEGTLSECIDKSIKTTHLSNNCSEDAYIEFYNSISQKIISCSEAEQPSEGGCACEITPEFKQEFKDKKLELKISKEGTDTLISPLNTELNASDDYILPDTELKATEQSGGLLNFIPIEKLIFSVEMDSSSLNRLKINDKNAGKKIYLYLRGKDLAIMPEEEYIKTLPIECKKQENREYKFCYKGTQKILSFDEKKAVYSIKQPEYRFALTFVDNVVPPQISDTATQDLKLAEGKILIQFSRPVQNNNYVEHINHYNIFCSEEMFTSTNKLSPTRSVKSDKEKISVVISKCGTSDIVDKKTYYVGVAAVGKSGNEIKDKIKTAVVVSIDDLPPSAAAVAAVIAAGENKIVIEFMPVTKNYDESEIKDLASYNIYLGSEILTNVKVENLQLNPQKRAFVDIIIPEDADASTYNLQTMAVFGVDDDGNVLLETKPFAEAFAQIYPALEDIPVLLPIVIKETALVQYKASPVVPVQNLLGTLSEKSLSDINRGKYNDMATPDQITNAIITESAKYKFDPDFVAAVIKQESRFIATARSGVGAEGLMQLMPDTAKQVGLSKDERTDPLKNIPAGTKYLNYVRSLCYNYYISKGILSEEDLYDLTLASYNAGPGGPSNEKKGVYSIVKKYGTDWRSHLPDETKKYIRIINGYYKDYKA